jgi:hypothetical protein
MSLIATAHGTLLTAFGTDLVPSDHPAGVDQRLDTLVASAGAGHQLTLGYRSLFLSLAFNVRVHALSMYCLAPVAADSLSPVAYPRCPPQLTTQVGVSNSLHSIGQRSAGSLLQMVASVLSASHADAALAVLALSTRRRELGAQVPQRRAASPSDPALTQAQDLVTHARDVIDGMTLPLVRDSLPGDGPILAGDHGDPGSGGTSGAGEAGPQASR